MLFLLISTKEKFCHSFRYQTVPVAYEPTVHLNTAALCIKDGYFIAKKGCITNKLSFIYYQKCPSDEIDRAITMKKPTLQGFCKLLKRQSHDFTAVYFFTIVFHC